MDKIKETLRSRRGIAIELAIAVMLFSLAFGMLLMTVTGLQTKHSVGISEKFATELEINQAGEQAVAEAIRSVNQEFDKSREKNYDYVYDSETGVITVTKDGETVLTIKIEGGKIVSWHR